MGWGEPVDRGHRVPLDSLVEGGEGEVVEVVHALGAHDLDAEAELVAVLLLGLQLHDLGEGVVGDGDHRLGAEILGDVDAHCGVTSMEISRS